MGKIIFANPLNVFVSSMSALSGEAKDIPSPVEKTNPVTYPFHHHFGARGYQHLRARVMQ